MPEYQWDDRPLETWLKKDIPSDAVEYAQWRKQNSPQFFFDKQPAGRVGAGPFRPVPIPGESPPNLPWNPQTAIDEADRLLNGGIKYFAHEFHQTGFPPYWHTDYFSSHVTLSDSEGSLSGQSETLRSQRTLPHPVPASLRESDMDKHWSQISDDNVITRRALALPDKAIPNYEETASAKTKSASPRHYDIKFIWEPNRFAFIYTLVRASAATQDEKYAEAFWQSIFDWAENNPPNTGPNWMDGQEIALRLMAWTFGYYQFSSSSSATPQRIAQFTQFVAAQAERIYKNIDYAISTRSNHTISEAFGLWLVGLLFPELEDSEKYFSLGRNLLEQEATAQILPDGSYSMYSLNYHRFILHIYLYAIQLGEINHFPLSAQLKESVTRSITCLSQLINPQTGEMPVYGSNDGALVLPLNNCDFTDYRPLLQLGWYVTQKEFLLEPGEWDEDVYWLCGKSLTAKGAKPAKENFNLRALSELRGESFPNGGIYLLRGSNSKAIIRCTDFRARPSHADQLHMDLWIHGRNIAVDAGTYLYSGQGIWRNGLAHTSTHNTVTVDDKDQMTLVSRFTWTNWSRGKVLQHSEKLWQGEHDSYKPVSHRRTVMALDDDRWLVLDHLSATGSHRYRLQWLLCDIPFEQKDSVVLMSLNGMKYKVQVGLTEGNGTFSLVRADPNSTRGWRSRYYAHKEPAISLMLEANQPRVTFWTFFGLEDDVVEVEQNLIKINSKKIPLVE